MISEDFPFNDTTLVIKVADKIFLLTDFTRDVPAVNLKCDPDLALELRARYDSVLPGYHMSKKHWNTVILDGSIPDEEVLRMIDHSYECVVAGLGRAEQAKMVGKLQKTKKPAGSGHGKAQSFSFTLLLRFLPDPTVPLRRLPAVPS